MEPTTVRMPTLRVGFGSLLLCGGLFACAVQAAPPAVTPSASADVAPNPCKQPPPLPRLEPSTQERARFHHAFDEYKRCVQTYAKSEEAIAHAHAAAAQKAIDDFNAFAKSLNNRGDNDSN